MLKVKKVSIVSLIALLCLLIAPFHVYADTISQANIKGANFECIDITPIESSEVNMYQNIYQRAIYTFHFQAVLDQSYYGYVTGRFQGTYQTYDPNTQSGVLTKTADSYNRSFYVCGQTIDYYMQTQGWIEVNQLNNYTITYATQTFTYSGSNVVPFGYQTTLDEIVQNIEQMQIDQQNIMSYLYDSTNGTILEQVMTSNDLLQQAGQMFFTMLLNVQDIDELMNKLKHWDIPLYSYQFIMQCISQLGLPSNYMDFSYFDYPIFTLQKNKVIYRDNKTANQEYMLICFYEAGNTINTVDNFFDIATDHVIISNELLRTSYYVPTGRYLNLYKIVYKYNYGGAQTISYTGETGRVFIPIYCGINNGYFDDDFKQIFGLIDTSHEEALDNNTDDMQESFDDMFEYESDFNADMNTALQDINVQFDVGNQLGSKFLASADWVRTQFNALTNNTPIGTVISFSLILGIAMLLVGKYL